MRANYVNAAAEKWYRNMSDNLADFPFSFVYDGQKVSCHVICSFSGSSGVEGNGGVSEDGGGTSTTQITGKISGVTSFANIRKGPGTSYDTNGTINVGTRITITRTVVAEGRTWGMFGTDQWVSMEFVTVE